MEFDLCPTVESAVELLASKALTKGLELTVFVEPNVPTMLRGDPGRVRQILTNLVANAVKFTESGDVAVLVTLEDEDSSHATIRFEIRDTGIGISDETQQKLFHAFAQADGSTTRKYGGTGLGLAISKRLVQLMGGDIGVRSAAGQGSTFWFTARFEMQSAAESDATRIPQAGQKVLIVDDNETNRKILHSRLAAWDIECAAAASGEDALRLLRAAAAIGKPFSQAMLDYQMPGMDGTGARDQR